ncbi:MAG: hypothetical protein CMF22_05255 [Idiomarinaceae bacterium]|nr:hypothetical protein [Idiomarinaceae bacterium]|tara:strand:- start:323 stop:514 length:192 start_codon:yes stop_codon:yes gene_type:complete
MRVELMVVVRVWVIWNITLMLGMDVMFQRKIKGVLIIFYMTSSDCTAEKAMQQYDNDKRPNRL